MGNNGTKSAAKRVRNRPNRMIMAMVRGFPVEFLSDAEAAAYGRFDGAPLRVELHRVFFLHDADRELIDKRRSAPS